MVWCRRRMDSDYEQGFYIFGGIDEREIYKNDLWLVAPDYDYNQTVINQDYSIVKGAKIGLTVKKIENYTGMPPCPRSQFQMTNLQSNGEQLLIVYGGRNDVIFKQTQNVALNDICVFNINKHQWEALAVFGQMPCSRWSHFMTKVNGDTDSAADGILIFGGVNIKSYCRSILWNFSLHEKEESQSPKKISHKTPI